MYGERIKALRLEQGLSQKEVSEKMHITQQTVSKYENEEIDLSTNMLLRFSEFFDVSIDYILGRVD